jgi:peptidyl-prolyl cis-trans isomerase B (cyclophilin B)
MESHRGRIGGAIVALLVASATATSMIGCGGDDTSTSEASASSCKRVNAERWVGSSNAPKYTVGKDDDLVAVVETNCGTFQIALDTRRATKTVSSFAALAKKGFYEGLTFDRMTPGVMIEGGNPRASGAKNIGPGYTIEEKPPPDLAYTRGVVAMEKRPSDPSGLSRSQFFVVLAPDAKLPPDYALIGKVDKGLDVVERISELGTPSGKPKQDVVIEWIWAKNRLE